MPGACPAGTVFFAAATFRMGSPPAEAGRDASEGPAHEVTVSAFCLDEHEVTEAAWTAGEGAAGPATGVTWAEADAWCRARGMRLPTEAEMERAIRDGSATAYPWGDAWPPPRPSVNARDLSLSRVEPDWVPGAELGYDDGSAGPWPVCSGGRDRRGLCDLLGNAAEWCADRYSAEEYSFARASDPRGPDARRLRAVRGGSFVQGPADLRAAARAGFDPEARSALVGWRCAADPTAPIAGAAGEARR